MSRSRSSRTITCPACLSSIRWRDTTLHGLDEDHYWWTPVDDPRPGESPARFRARHPFLKRKCTDPQAVGAHYLPDRYGDFGDPIVIGVVGGATVGKTVYVTALVHSLLNSANLLADAGLTVLPLDPLMHRSFLDLNISPLFHDGVDLAGTATQTTIPEMTYAVHIVNNTTGRQYALCFYDVAGEELSRTGFPGGSRYLHAASGLIFLVDPGKAVPRAAKWPRGHHHHSVDGSGRPLAPIFDPTFDAICHGLSAVPDRPVIPAAIVVTKSDLLQHHNRHVADWIFRDDDADSTSVPQESADVHAFLETNGAEDYLRPVHHFRPISLHFASATGVRAVDRRFPVDRLRPRRVLRPFLTILRARGVL
ncbi:hypothetical protein [Actinosynnema sp. NPDC020468]|uniref:hypothetical protein n=1 Tax=Actinosynnema sp. NPDC020468 TaxID=3154488 RepID=UPI0033F8FE0E